MSEDRPSFAITEDSPTPLVRDFELFLDTVAKPSAYLTQARRALDRATLYAANQLMRTEQTDTHPRTDQHGYPLLNFLQKLCLAARLHVMDHVKGKLRVVPTDRLPQFRALNATEKYLALLEAFWVDCDWADLGASDRGFSFLLMRGDVGDPARLLAGLPAGEKVDLFSRSGRPQLHFPHHYHVVIPIFSFFGFLDYTPLPPRVAYARKGEIFAQSVTLSALGKAFLTVLSERRPLSFWNLPTRREWGPEPHPFPGQSAEPDDGGVTEPTPFHEAFLPLLPPGCVTRGVPRLQRRAGDRTLVFRVALGDVTRTIALSSRHSLEDLHLAIQHAYRFDNDHLYAFYMDGKPYSRFAYNDPRGGSDPPYADEAVLGKLELFARQPILYLFDFGDNWQFDVELVEARDEPHKGRPKIVAREGESPPQYPDLDEEW